MDAPILADPLQIVERKQGMKEKQPNETPDGTECLTGRGMRKTPTPRCGLHPVGIRLFRA